MVKKRTEEIFRQERQRVFSSTDKLFAKLAIWQFVAGVLAALWITPKTYIGLKPEVHIHMVAALGLGLLFLLPVLYLAHRHPGERYTRYTIASCQMLMGALLIHVTGGRIETHFHVFGSLAFLSFYRDWKVFVPATLVVAVDHLVRGLFFPESVFGVVAASQWRWAEHAAWVLFCDYFLVKSVLSQRQEMWNHAKHQAALERTTDIVEAEVKRRTRQLEQEREKFENAFQYAPIGMAMVEQDEGEILKVNRELLDIVGYEESELVGQCFSRLPENGEQSPDVQSLLRGESNVEYENNYVRADGSHARVIFKATLLGSSGVYVVQVLDITQRVEAEKRLREQNELLSRSQKMESLGVLAGGIAHELNSPIQFIGGNLKFLREAYEDIQELVAPITEEDEQLDVASLKNSAEELDISDLLEDVSGAIKESIDGVGRITCIVKSMRDYSHPGGEIEQIDLNQVMQTATTVARNEWKYVADTQLELADDLLPVQGNRSELMQVFLNLIVNAAHAIQEKADKSESGGQGTITIRTRNVEGKVEVMVQDTGTGIPESVKAKIFDPFFTTKPVGKGTGQGLAITSTIVANHNAKLTVESEQGQGTSFFVTFDSPEEQESAKPLAS